MGKIHKSYIGIAVVICLCLAIVLLGLKKLPGEGDSKFDWERTQPELSRRDERTITLTYSFEIKELPEQSHQIYAWVPVPRTGPHQHLEGFRVLDGLPYKILTESEYGNHFIHLDLSKRVYRKSEKIPVTIAFSVTRRAYRFEDQLRDREYILKQDNLQRFLMPDRLIPIDGKVADEAKEIVGSSAIPLEQARLLYDHIIKSLRYDKTGIEWGKGDAIYACDVRKGNCTDFHSLFIGEARALGIPARFIMGISLPEGKSGETNLGYHCWAEFYVEGKGWIPIDASEANKYPKKAEFFFGGLDENRVAFTIGRDIHLPGASTNSFNFVIYPYVEVDGKPYERVETSFSFREGNI